MYKFLFKTPICKSSHRFKLQYDFNTRKSESTKILSKEQLSDKLPIIVEKSENCSLPNINNKKFIVRKNLTVGSLIYILRKNTNIKDYEGVYLFINDKIIPKLSDTIEYLYEKYKDDDGFLYFTYCTENIFG